MSESWYGWLRRDRRHKWHRVCGPCPMLTECSRQLGAEAKRQGIPDKYTCLTTGAYPRDVSGSRQPAQEQRSKDETAPPSGRYLGGF